jgi:hypothetical protein
VCEIGKIRNQLQHARVHCGSGGTTIHVRRVWLGMRCGILLLLLLQQLLHVMIGLSVITVMVVIMAVMAAVSMAAETTRNDVSSSIAAMVPHIAPLVDNHCALDLSHCGLTLPAVQMATQMLDDVRFTLCVDHALEEAIIHVHADLRVDVPEDVPSLVGTVVVSLFLDDAIRTDDLDVEAAWYEPIVGFEVECEVSVGESM